MMRLLGRHERIGVMIKVSAQLPLFNLGADPCD
jgi:hypothetical protein